MTMAEGTEKIVVAKNCNREPGPGIQLRMNLTGNTILITGGGSGIGLALAAELQKLGNQVVIAGRRKPALEAAAAAHPGLKWLQLNVEDAAAVKAFAASAVADYPALNVLINNAGIMRAENYLAEPVDLSVAETEISTNLLGPVRLTAALLPHLRRQAHAAIMNVSSGLAFLPMALTPVYCATKAALHSWTESLRYQLRDTRVDVQELIPPYVATDLMDGREDPLAMPLSDYIAEVMQILKDNPRVKEIAVERVKPLRNAVERGNYDKVFAGLNGSRPPRT